MAKRKPAYAVYGGYVTCSLGGMIEAQIGTLDGSNTIERAERALVDIGIVKRRTKLTRLSQSKIAKIVKALVDARAEARDLKNKLGNVASNIFGDRSIAFDDWEDYL